MKKEHYYRLSKYISLENIDNDGNRVVVNINTGRRTKISPETMILLSFFKEKSTISAACMVFGRGVRQKNTISSLILQLINNTILVDEGADERLIQEEVEEYLSVPRLTFAGFPSRNKNLIQNNDIVIVGIPSDIAVTSYPGTRMGPEALRAISSEHLCYESDIFTGNSKGWFNADLGRQILSGKSFVDLGDIIVKPDDSPENLFQKIGLCTDMIVSKNALPVFFGGDHSISAPIIESLARRHADLTVIHLDAHTDLASWTHGKTHHHGSFMSRVLKKAGISEVYHYGMRGFSGEPYSCKQDCAIKYRYCSTKQLDAAFLNDTWQELIPVGKTCYISLDIDILDPVFAPGVGTPVPFGLEPKKLCSILEALATKNKMVGFDIVELCPPRDVGMMTAHLAFHLTTSLLSWSWDK